MRPAKPSLALPSGSRISTSVLAPPGLRERKKAQMRVRISDIATALFLERGFDEVTVAQVAKAADVSVKTVFNYFGSKEDLLFDREPEWLASIDELAARQAPGVGFIRVLQQDVAVRWPALDFGRWDLLGDDSIAGRRAFYRLVEEHAGLQARRRLMNERIGDRIAAIVGAEFGDPDGFEALTAGALVPRAYDVPGKEMARLLLTEAPAHVVAERARDAGLHALAVLERAYAGTPLVDGPTEH